MTHRTRSGHISHTPYPRWARILIIYCGIVLALHYAYKAGRRLDWRQ